MPLESNPRSLVLSGASKADVSMLIFFYALLTLLISAQQAAVPRDAYVDALLPVGLALYAAGEAGNLYHHALLARMRQPPKEQATMLRGMSALALAATAPARF